jgi:hypothetical protein
MPGEPPSAVVEIRCDVSQIEKLRAIPNLIFQRPPAPTAQANIRIVYALADASAQDQAKALGCDVTVIKSADEYSEQVRSVYDNISDKPITID